MFDHGEEDSEFGGLIIHIHFFGEKKHIFDNYISPYKSPTNPLLGK